MIDFSRLRSEPGGQRTAFEGLICHLGRRLRPTDGQQFIRIDGSGGDGGVEAYWQCNDGKEIGYQAKFHQRSADIDWRRLDSSIRTALSSRPRLKRIDTYAGSDELIAPLFASVRNLAAAMAAGKRDYVPIETAQDLLRDAFKGFHSGERAWLDILRLSGLLRLDPLTTQDDDPLAAPAPIIRFSFQRFQDHLIAEALLANVDPNPSAFHDGGSLAFLLRKFDNGRYSIAYPWDGVVEALWIGHAELNGRELIDDVPLRAKTAMRSQLFVESVYWRASTAFSDRTLELFNQWIVRPGKADPYRHLCVFLRLAVSDHPWNSDFLHAYLVNLPLPERDRVWTHSINLMTSEIGDGNEVETIIKWCLSDAIDAATDKVLARALTVLGWLFSSTNRKVRDLSTKAASSILTGRRSLLSPYLERFAAVDDLYVVERCLGACAASCLRDPSPARLKTAAETVYETVFKDRAPPLHLLARDYARLIMELAHGLNVLLPSIDLQRCRPPYHSAPPEFDGIEEIAKQSAAITGAKDILRSCAEWAGDFGRYVVERRVQQVTIIPLSSPAPVAPDTDRWEFKQSFLIDKDAAKFWTAHRAIEFGWTADRFPRDYYTSSEAHNARIERIGKKFQWMAFHELMARLADNRWLLTDETEFGVIAYDTPLDTSYLRDIEITLPPLPNSDESLNDEYELVRPPITPVAVDQQHAWVSDSRYAEAELSASQLLSFEGDDDWVTLYRYSSADLNWPTVDGRLRPRFRQDQFSYTFLIGAPIDEEEALLDQAQQAKTDFHSWLPYTRTDEGYVYELGLRNTWNDGRHTFRDDRSGFDDRYVHLTVGYHWENHLDATMPSGIQINLPAAWLLHGLDLRANPRRLGYYQTQDGVPTIIAGYSHRHNWCVARRRAVMDLLEKARLKPVLLGVGERSAYGSDGEGPHLQTRWNGTMRRVNNNWVSQHW